MEWDNVYYTRVGAELEAGSFRGPVLTGEQSMGLSAVLSLALGAAYG